MHHRIHPKNSLDGLWQFAFLGEEPYAGSEQTAWTLALIPSAFDALPDHAGQRGRAVYQTSFFCPAGQTGVLRFEAVSMRAEIWVDGQNLASHACGYAPFDVHVPPSTATERELVVIVDNRFDFATCPMHEECFDFYQYGGILRSVSFRPLPTGPWVRSLRVLPTAGYRDGEVEVTVEVGNAEDASTLRVFSAGQELASIGLDAAGRFGPAIVRVPDPRVWSPQDPALHELRVALVDRQGAECDDAEVTFGLRRIETRDGRLWLNGERLVLKGYNRHEWHPNFGPCTPVAQMLADLQLMRKLGCNFVRGSHYPQDQRFLDLCDRMGFLVWEENLGWGQREKTFASELFRRHHAETLEAMVRASWNHPSVILWGFLNEAGTDQDYCGETIEESVRLIRSLDASRPITFASMFGMVDRHFDKVDVISINQYPGWYGCEGHPDPLSLVAPGIAATVESIDRRGFRAKPIIVSEIGAEALYGWRDPHNDFFTEDYQAEYLRTACEAVLGNDRLSGIALWHFSDARTYGGCRAMVRPRTFNNKGTFDEYRRPKAAAQAVSMVFHQSTSTS
ncbi:MAG: glycoside hydrolase family 2 TIM barrel-domain containing protein [Terrimicrobiaceae bacterium]|nr:glycoside hydrolase family 2 TIM barrel-domain containing protein [Terrimicrobiaceae bacterium]